MTQGNWLRKLTLGLSLLLVLIVAPLYAIKVDRKSDYMDFDVYYRAASRAKAGLWDQIYTLADGASPYRYAPPSIPLFRPFAELSSSQARLLWYFLQFAWFAAGFYLIYQALRRVTGRRRNQSRVDALWATALAFLFILRLCLDCFTIGQVSSLLFLGFCLSFHAWVIKRPGLAGGALSLPTGFKIGPGFLYFLFLSARRRERILAILAPLTLGLLACGLSALEFGSLERTRMLWTNWMEIVAKDSVYYDASHYGSQSLKSALLRLANWGWMTSDAATSTFVGIAVLVCAALIGFWFLFRARGFYGRALFFALGIFPYLWFMPETFKYSLTGLAIPVALLFTAPRPTRLSRFALAFGFLTISLAGKDLIDPLHPTLFFDLQKYSLPFLATLLLGAGILQQCLWHSRPSPFARFLKSLLRPEKLGPWRLLDSSAQASPVDISLLIPLPLQSFAELRRETVEQALRDARSSLTGKSFEILCLPYGDRVSADHPLLKTVRQAALELPGVRLLEGPVHEGRGAALREAFLSSTGNRICVMQVEQPCESGFFLQALKLLDEGVDLVRANRRLEETRFRIPVRLLSLVYRRHRLGLAFNRIVRAFLPITTSDTHSGNWAASRRLMERAFALQNSSDFLFELELALTARAHQYREQDLPIRVLLAEEKSSFRMFREVLIILFGLPRLAWRYHSGCYDAPPTPRGITADDWGLTPGVNRGILELMRLGVVRRTSLMAKSGYLRHGIEELKALRPEVELGLHFDLTYGKTSPGKLLLQWASPFSDRARLREEVRNELRAQLQILRDADVQPTYLDGHHHVHVFPGVLDSITDILQESGITVVRLPYDPSLWFSGKSVLNLLSLLARPVARRNGLRSLPCFYPKPVHFQDHGLLRSRLFRSPETEIIVHPARVNDLGELKIPDPYQADRVVEFRALRMLSLLSRERLS